LQPAHQRGITDQLGDWSIDAAGFTHEPVVQLPSVWCNSPCRAGALLYAQTAHRHEIALKMSAHYWRNMRSHRRQILSAWKTAITRDLSALS